jgi:uncharacterized protein YpuA (DUF1002 family)
VLDTLRYVKKLEGVGYSNQQAEAQIEIMSEIVRVNLATREDLKDVRAEIKDVRIELKQELRETRLELRQELLQMESRVNARIQKFKLQLILIMGSMLATSTGLTVALIQLLK